MSPPVRVHDSRRDGRCSREKPARLDVPRAVLGGSRRSRFSAESAIDVRFHGDSESWRPLPEMIYRHWGTPPAWRPRLGSWRWRRVAAPAATCRPVRCGEPRSARRDIRQRTENRGRGPDGTPQGVESCLGFRKLENVGALPVMIHRHWGTAPAWRPRFQSWCRHRVAAHAAVCRRCAAVNHAPPVALSAARK